MQTTMYGFDDVCRLINNGHTLLIAGDENLLDKLPKGKWIAGTTPYFMSGDGCLISKDLLSVVDLTNITDSVEITTYDIVSIKNIYRDSKQGGFSVIIIPAFSDIHVSFAINAQDYHDFGVVPLVGWVSGFLLSDVSAMAKTYYGPSAAASHALAVVMHVALPANKYADLGIVNLFEQGNGDEIEFLETGFSVSEALVNGNKTDFSTYLKCNGIDTRLPLVADYNSERINTSIKDVCSGRVSFYAPVFRGVKYKVAAPIGDYVNGFTDAVEKQNLSPLYACNCILNFLYSNLEGKRTGDIVGPITFGEIGYILLNQTLVALSIKDLK